MTFPIPALALLAVALVLALAFHRNRAVQVFASLAALAGGVASADPRLVEAALRFAPWLVVAACLTPEPRLVSRRNGFFVLALLAAIALAYVAPEHVYRLFADASATLALGLVPSRAAAWLLVVAAALSALRWSLTRRPMDIGLALAIVPTALGCFAAKPDAMLAGATMAGAIGLLAVLYASYRMAFVDGLTGLPNRRALDETLQRLSGTYALAMVDVDHFKKFNDTFGHAAGDVVLRRVAQTLRRSATGGAFRYGGEEFCLLFEGSHAALAGDGCERARAAIAEQRIVVPAAPKRAKKPSASGNGKGDKQVEVQVTISVGCAARGGERKHAADVLKAADQALYRAKAKGRNRVVNA